MEQAPAGLRSLILTKELIINNRFYETLAKIDKEGRGPSRLDEEPLGGKIVVEMGDELAITVPNQGRTAVIQAEHALGCLAPARMGNVRVDVGPKAVLAR
jgi:hypothetical protein